MNVSCGERTHSLPSLRFSIVFLRTHPHCPFNTVSRKVHEIIVYFINIPTWSKDPTMYGAVFEELYLLHLEH